MKSITIKEMMKEAHARAKTYKGHYKACLKLAIIELRREYKILISVRKSIKKVHTYDASRFNPIHVEMIETFINERKKLSQEQKKEKLNYIFNTAENDAQLIVITFESFKKGFMKLVNKHAHQFNVYGHDALYQEILLKTMESIGVRGNIAHSTLVQYFLGMLLNVTKTEKLRHAKNLHTSLNEVDSEGKEVAEVLLYNSDVQEYFGKIPVDKIIRDLDTERIFTSEEREIMQLLLKGYKKVEIDQYFGQRMDRKYKNMQQKAWEYFGQYIEIQKAI